VIKLSSYSCISCFSQHFT